MHIMNSMEQNKSMAYPAVKKGMVLLWKKEHIK